MPSTCGVVAALALALALPLTCCAGDFSGRVISVTDGDTLKVLVEQQPIKIRLTEIDAPEKKQAFGARSRQSLADLCFGENARVEDHGHDRYGRTLGRVYCDGIDANAEQIRRGMAWVYEHYATDLRLYALQAAAQASGIGLWVDARPMPPWKWRHARRHTRHQ